MHRILATLLLVALGLVTRSSPAAEASGPCSNPRAAVQSVFAWQQPTASNLSKAAACLDLENPTEREVAARHLKRVYEARGYVVQLKKLSEDPDFIDPRTHEAEVTPHSGLPEVRVARQADGRWLWTEDSLARVEELFTEMHGPLDSLVERLPPSFAERVLGVALWQYLALLLLGLVALVLRKVLEFTVKRQVRELSVRFGALWTAHLVASIASPGATLAAAVLLRVAYPQLQLPLGAAVVMEFVVRLLVILSIVWAAYRLVDVVAAQLAARAAATESKLDDQLVPLLRKSLKLVVVLAGALFLLQNFNVDVGSLLAGLGLGGLAFALAAKDTLANFFGSIMIFADRPFQVGDWVVVKDVEGIVEEVGFRSTRIRTFYNSQVTVPNAVFADAQIDNYGRRRYRRTVTTLNVTYDTTPEQLQAFVEGIRAIILANEYSRKDYYEVHMSGFGSHSLDVMVYFFLEVSNWSLELRERHNIFLEIMRLAQALNVVFAFPTQTLQLEYVSQPGAARAVPSPPAEAELEQRVRAFGPNGERARPRGPKITPDSFAAKPELASHFQVRSREGS